MGTDLIVITVAVFILLGVYGIAETIHGTRARRRGHQPPPVKEGTDDGN